MKTPFTFGKAEHLKDATLMQCVAQIIKHYAEEGCTNEDIANVVKKELPQWKPQSVSPSISYLRDLGCIKVETNFGVRRLYHVRDYNVDKDRAKLTKLREAAVGKRDKPGKKGKVPEVMLSIAFGENRTETLTLEEWRGVYEQLHEIFGGHR